MNNLNNMMEARKIHFIGIGGSGMSGIASVLHDIGYEVSGSDINNSSNLESLISKGLNITIGHREENILGKEVVVISSAISSDNIEVIAARNLGIPIIMRAQMLAELMRFSYGIAVAGTHGKTTATSILVHILCKAGIDPTYIIGGKIIDSSNAGLGTSQYLVAEADESDASFIHLQPIISVITNIDKDHLVNHSNNFDTLKENFVKFIHNLPFYGLCIININDIEILSIMDKISRPIKTFGIEKKCDYMAKKIDISDESSVYKVVEDSEEYEIKFNMPGRHNIFNSLSAISVARELGVKIKDIQESLKNFHGIKRRFEILGDFRFKKGTFKWIDDYGHHPSEIREILYSIKNIWPKRRIIFIFQPHRYTRTKELYEQFKEVLINTECLILTDIYPAGEEKIENISGYSLFESVKKYNKNIFYVENIDDLDNIVNSNICDNDILLTMGAGDISKFVENYLKYLKNDK
ncbi:MAG: UDP-N-acetylmuramate--L-alanine ligase [Gammaproteobacteria bacterium]|nr:UDP-N-acetylmuramate--L-alanine ligase [Gammaproteobacteria bacterium]